MRILREILFGGGRMCFSVDVGGVPSEMALRGVPAEIFSQFRSSGLAEAGRV
jgi:hypothetical protein